MKYCQCEQEVNDGSVAERETRDPRGVQWLSGSNNTIQTMEKIPDVIPAMATALDDSPTPTTMALHDTAEMNVPGGTIRSTEEEKNEHKQVRKL